MKRPRLAFRVAALLLAIALASLGAVGAAAFAALRLAWSDASRFALRESGLALATQVPDRALAPGPEAEAWTQAIGSAAKFRLTLVDTDGRVLADSRAHSAEMGNHLDREEVAQALSGGEGWASRRSDTLKVDMLYAAAPVLRDGRVVGALRLAYAVPELSSLLEPLLGTALAGGLLLVLAWVAIARGLGRRLLKPLEDLRQTARAWGSGQLSARAGHQDSAELEELALALDGMAAQLDARARESEARGRELLGILDGMSEAVAAVDASLRVTRLNPAARRLFGLSGAEPGHIGGGLLETLRSTELATAAERCMAEGGTVEAELSIIRDGRAWFLVYAAPLMDEAGAIEGAVLVLNDITRLRRLEQVRTDFVANVSHELKTPVTLIKGFAEALQDGALERPDEARRFLDIIARHTERLDAIIDDLLALARLEQGEGRVGLAPCRLEELLGNAIATMASRAEAQGSELRLHCEPGLRASLNAGLLEQALCNLIDNALKYSPPGSPVDLSATVGPERLRLEVADRGPGIPAKDSARIFERFYRLDRARSRELGGTGLGLAIVRHIALAHGGEAGVASRPGGGSVFWMDLPQAVGLAPSAADAVGPPAAPVAPAGPATPAG